MGAVVGIPSRRQTPYTASMRPPAFSLQLLDRLGDRAETDVAAGTGLLVGGVEADPWRRIVGFRDSVAGEAPSRPVVAQIFCAAGLQ